MALYLFWRKCYVKATKLIFVLQNREILNHQVYGAALLLYKQHRYKSIYSLDILWV